MGKRKNKSSSFRRKRWASSIQGNSNQVNDSGANIQNSGNNNFIQSITINQNEIPSTSQANDLEMDFTFELNENLECLYGQATLPRTAWMNSGTDLCLEKYYVNLWLQDDKEIQLPELFLEEQNQKIRRILIQGQPGSGKTTLSTKLAYDSAKHKEYLSKFKLVFFIKLKSLKSYSMKEAFEQRGRSAGFQDMEALHEVIKKNSKDMLIIMDGLDELKKGYTPDDEIMQVIYGTMYPEATVVVTCRTDLFRPSEFKQQHDEDFPRKMKFWYRKVSIMRLKSDKMKQLFKIHAPEISDEVIDRLNSSNAKDILRTPLIVMLIAYLHGQGIIVTGKETMTQLFKELFNGLISYGLARIKCEIQGDYFTPSVSEMNVVVELQKFEEFCFQMWKENKLSLDETEFKHVEKIYQLGFLTKNPCEKLFKESVTYELFHRTFLEFFVADYIQREIVTSGNVNPTLIECVQRELFEQYSASLIPMFVIGLMGTLSHLLLKQLIGNAYLNSFSKEFWAMLNECEVTDELMETLLPFLPILMDNQFFRDVSEHLLEPILKFASERRSLRGLEIKSWNESSTEFLAAMNGPFHVDCVSMKTSGSAMDLRIIDKLCCDSFTLCLSKELKDCDVMSDVFVIFSKQSTNQKILRLTSSLQGIEFNKFITNSRITDGEFSLDKLICPSCILNNPESGFSRLVGSNRIRALHLWKDYHAAFDSIIDSPSLSVIENSPSLTEVHLEHLEIDLYMLTNGGTKNWQLISFGYCTLFCSRPMNECCAINYLRLNYDMFRIANDMLQWNVSMLKCDKNDLNRLAKPGSDFSEQIFTFTSELILPSQWFTEDVFENLTRFRNVRRLSIQFYLYDQHKSSLFYKLLCLVLTDLSLIILQVVRVSPSTFLTELDKFENFHLKSINLVLEPENYIDKELLQENVKGLLLSGKVQRIRLIFLKSRQDVCSSFTMNIISKLDSSIYRSEMSFAGENDDEMEYWTRKYKAGMRFCMYTIRPTLRESEHSKTENVATT